MKKTSLLCFLLALVMCTGLVSCGESGAASTTAATTTATPAADNTTAAADVTTAEATTAEATTAAVTTEEVTTEGKTVVEYGINGYGKLDSTELLNLKGVLPANLPDNSIITEFVRPYCFDDVMSDDSVTLLMYNIEGKSQPTAKLVNTDNGAIFGTAIKFAGYGATVGGDRGELTLSFYNDDGNIENNVQGYKGILFYVDFSHVEPAEGKEMCASVTINTNKVRCNIADHGSVGYYYDGSSWIETHNYNACRMQIPSKFTGWIYVPATSFIFTSDSTSAADSDGLFTDITVENMRLYTDGYTYATDETNYIIFDEVLYVK